MGTSSAKPYIALILSILKYCFLEFVVIEDVVLLFVKSTAERAKDDALNICYIKWGFDQITLVFPADLFEIVGNPQLNRSLIFITIVVFLSCYSF